jgi:hypothetical protein
MVEPCRSGNDDRTTVPKGDGDVWCSKGPGVVESANVYAHDRPSQGISACEGRSRQVSKAAATLISANMSIESGAQQTSLEILTDQIAYFTGRVSHATGSHAI